MFAHAQFKRKYTRDLLVDNDLHLSYQKQCIGIAQQNTDALTS